MALIENKKVYLNYDILEEFEAGIELSGNEVKALRNKHGKLDGSHIIVRPSGRAGGNEAYIVGMSIPAYQPTNTVTLSDPERSRKLLLNKKELATLAAQEGQKGLTIVPISIYNKGRVLKMKLGVARGRKIYDKRAVLKERDTKREIDRTLKNKK